MSAFRFIVLPWPPPPEATSRSSPAVLPRPRLRRNRPGHRQAAAPQADLPGRGIRRRGARQTACSGRRRPLPQPGSDCRPDPCQVPGSRRPRGVDPGGARRLRPPNHRARARRGEDPQARRRLPRLALHGPQEVLPAVPTAPADRALRGRRARLRWAVRPAARPPHHPPARLRQPLPSARMPTDEASHDPADPLDHFLGPGPGRPL